MALAKQLRRKHLSLREISAELFTAGHTTKPGKPFTPQSIANMLADSARYVGRNSHIFRGKAVRRLLGDVK